MLGRQTLARVTGSPCAPARMRKYGDPPEGSLCTEDPVSARGLSRHAAAAMCGQQWFIDGHGIGGDDREAGAHHLDAQRVPGESADTAPRA